MPSSHPPPRRAPARPTSGTRRSRLAERADEVEHVALAIQSNERSHRIPIAFANRFPDWARAVLAVLRADVDTEHRRLAARPPPLAKPPIVQNWPKGDASEVDKCAALRGGEETALRGAVRASSQMLPQRN